MARPGLAASWLLSPLLLETSTLHKPQPGFPGPPACVKPEPPACILVWKQYCSKQLLEYLFPGKEPGTWARAGPPLGSPGGSSLTAPPSFPGQDLVATTGFCTVALAPSVHVAWSTLCSLHAEPWVPEEGKRKRREEER